jgi:hypothetical protein
VERFNLIAPSALRENQHRLAVADQFPARRIVTHTPTSLCEIAKPVESTVARWKFTVLLNRRAVEWPSPSPWYDESS